MNPILEKSIAELQQNQRRLEQAGQPTDDDLAVMAALVKQIQSVKLGRKFDKRGDRNAWLECVDKTRLLDGLAPSGVQRQFLVSETLKVRAMTAGDEGPTARIVDLFTINTETNAETGHLMGAVALGPKDTQDDTHIIYSMGSGVALPGTPEFDDIQTIMNNFGPVSS